MSTPDTFRSTTYPEENGEAVVAPSPAGVSMRATVAKAFGYNTASAFISQLISFVRSIILARLLAPTDFGLFGMAMMTILATDVLLNLQLNVSLIPRAFQHAAEEKRWLNTVWSLEQFRGFAVFLFSCVLAWPVSVYFGDSRVFPIIVAASLASLLGGFNNVGMTLHQKNINFRNVVIWEQVSALVGLAITVALAYWMRSALALAWGFALTAVCKIVLSYVLHPYRPSWGIDREAFRESVRFGGNLLIIGILTYVTTQFDNVVIGKWLGADNLGAYLLAYQLAMLPVLLLGSIVNRTMFPVYSQLLRENRRRGFEVWALTVKYCAWVLLLICIPVWAESDSLIHLVYGPKWAAAVAPLVILIFAGIFRAMTRVSSAMLLALGKPHLDARAKMVETVVFVVLVLGLVKPYGTVGAAWAGVGCYVLAFLLRTISVAMLTREIVPRLMSFVPDLAVGVSVGMLTGWGLRQLGASLFLTLPAVALSIALCAVVMEARNLKSFLASREDSGTRPSPVTGKDELSLNKEWSIGEKAFAVLIQELRANAAHTIVEFGAGRSSVRFALELPEAEIHSIEHDEHYYNKTVDLLTRHAPGSRVQLHLRPLTWQRHASGLYLSYGRGSLPESIDAVIIDGPPRWTRRGREACLYQALAKLRVGGCVYLDDFSRPEEQQIARNWSRTLGNAFRFREMGVVHHWCVLQKQRPLKRPRWNVDVAIDSWRESLRWIHEAFRDKLTIISQSAGRSPSLGGAAEQPD